LQFGNSLLTATQEIQNLQSHGMRKRFANLRLSFEYLITSVDFSFAYQVLNLPFKTPLSKLRATLSALT
jgi:hypothetical protein